MKTKEELLKIYSTYLPYGLNVMRPDGQTILPLIGIQDDLLMFREEFITHGDITKNKPILYSMDMLTKPIIHNGEKIILLHKILESYCFDLSKMEEEEILSYAESLIEIDMSYSTSQILLEHHFNIFGLSEEEYIKKELL